MEQNIIPEGYKQTDIGVIPDDWVAVKFGDIVTLRNERINPQIKGHSNFCIELEHIDKVKGLLNGHTVTTKKSSIKNLFQENDVLFGKLRSYLRKYYYAQERGSCSTEIWVFRAIDSLLNSGYLNQIIRTDNFIECSSASSGTHMPRSEWGVVKQLILPLPKDITEQTAIANVLSDVDALIASIEKLIAKKQAIKTATMQQLLTGKKRLPPFDTYQKNDLVVIQGNKQIGQSKGTQQTELGEIPEDWGIINLCDLVNQSNHIRYGVVQPGQFDANGCLMLRSQDYSKGWKGVDGMHRINENLEKQFSNAKLAKGDLVITIVGAGVAQIAEIPKWIEGAVLSRSTARISVSPELANNKFVYHFMASELGRKQVLFNIKEGAQPVVSSQDVGNCLISFPSVYEQELIANVLSSMDEELSCLNKRLAKTQQIKQGMMQELLTGKTRLPVADL